MVVAADVEAKIDFSEVHVTRPSKTRYTRVQKVESDQADMRVAVSTVQGQTGWQPGFKKTILNRVSHKEEVLPARGQKRTLASTKMRRRRHLDSCRSAPAN
jgi:hypothetical protein